jgi:hypothetical protein
MKKRISTQALVEQLSSHIALIPFRNKSFRFYRKRKDRPESYDPTLRHQLEYAIGI